MYKVLESGGFPFGGKVYQEHQVYSLSDWSASDIKNAVQSGMIVKLPPVKKESKDGESISS